MSEYGLTPKGPNIKRLDTIIEEMHDELSALWGVNTRQNPQSFINHLLTNIADIAAELWEFGEDIYYSKYPSTAEGSSLDNAAQYGGITRETAAKSYYPIHCTGTDGTKLTAGTMISSKTNPTTYLTLAEEKEITRSSFNKAVIKVVAAVADAVYTVMIDNDSYLSMSTEVDELKILQGLQGAISKNPNFVATLDEENALLTIESAVKDTSHAMVLSENLTTDTVTSILTFGTTETGDILVPEGVITGIVKADAGLLSVVNLCGYVPGNKEETDPEFRQSYTDKIFGRSSMMLESIRSAILNNVQGVKNVAPYENATDEVDAQGRPPHSIEIVVDGGDNTQIAQQILANKAGGIATYGDTLVTLPGVYDEDIPIRFNRPKPVFVWLQLCVFKKRNEDLPANYAELLKEAVLENIGSLKAGDDVVPQEFMSDLYKACPGISYIDIGIFQTLDEGEMPDEYAERSVYIAARQRAYIEEKMIEVILNE